MNRILEEVQSGKFDPVKEFTGSEEKVLEVKNAMESISNNLSKDVCIQFVLTKIIPIIFDKNVDGIVRNSTVEMGLHFLQFANVSNLSTKEQEHVFSAIEEKYTKVIGELLESNYPDWDKLWIFLIKLCNKKLHFKLSVANKLLRVVEVAFRNSNSIDQRLKAYDCWVELINNSSLNMDHMSSAKQITLLVTPLKAKFSRMPVVIMKRCDTFVYLLEKLQAKATLCLKEFLEFCFGPFDKKNDVEKMRQGRTVPEVCSKSTKVLLEIMGHSHEDKDSCLKTDDLRLFAPLITDSNFANFAEILINSVTECCILMSEWSQDSDVNNTIIKCLWRSLLQFIRRSDEDVKKKCHVQINNLLKKLLDRSRSNENLHTVLENIIDLLVQDEIVEKLKDTVFEVCMSLLHQPTNSRSFNLGTIQTFITSCFDPENGSKFDKIASNSFRTNSKCQNPFMCEVWLKCKITIVPENVSNFIWPVRHYQKFEDIEALNSKWTKLYNDDCKSESVKLLILKELGELFKENPLLGGSVVKFLDLITAEEVNPSKDFVAKLLRLIELILTLPNLPDSEATKISSIVLTFCNQNHSFYKLENNDEALEKLCSCLEYLITIHKKYAVLSELGECLQNSHPKNLAKFSKRLLSFLETFMLNDDNPIVSTTRKLIELLETKAETEAPALTSRSMRIMSMANSSSKPRNTTLSTLSTKSRVSSPQLKNRIDNKKKNEPVVPLTQDNSSDYVKIDTEVKVDLDKLSEHQKEMLTRRREDIPALYQDLTQSQSQDFFKSQEVEEKISAKRKNREDDEDEFVSKIPKIDENEPIMDKEIEEDTDVTQICDEFVNSIPKTPPTILFEEPSKCNEEVEKKEEVESSKCNEEDEKKEEVQVNGTTEENMSPKSRMKSEKKKSESPVRKSQRNTASRIRERLVDAVKKQLNEAEREEDVNEGEENHCENSDVNSGEKLKKEKPSLRKSQRNTHKRYSDFLVTLEKKKNVKSEERRRSLDNPTRKNNKTKKNKKPKEDAEESFAELIERLDKQIEENKRAQNQNIKKEEVKEEPSDLQDSNQNEILVEKKEIGEPIQEKPKPDVYEFKAEEETNTEEMKKRKYRKKHTSFDRSDYIKRKKRPRKDTRSEGFPFHVTADSAIPLSKSSSLRAVPSQENETITIVITRSPPNIAKDNQECAKLTENISSSPKRRSKRKQVFPSSEDFIESSQETPEKQISPKNKKKENENPEATADQNEENEDRTSAPVRLNTRRFSLTEPASEKVTLRKIRKSRSLDKLDYAKEITFSLEKPSNHIDDAIADTVTQTEDVEVAETLTLKSPPKDELLPTAETLTLETPPKDDLPGSPITVDTPDRTTELFNNTLDISPISAESTTPVAKLPTSEVSNFRVARLLQMVNSNVQVRSEGRKWFGSKHSSPSTSRIKKMKMKKKEEDLDILTFSREVPSPLTVPASGILKRKLSSLEETATPSPKRKRVNFSDPATTARKIFIKESEEYEDEKKSTNEEESKFSNDVNHEDALLSVRGLCDPDTLDNEEIKSTLYRLLRGLKVPEVVALLSEYLSKSEDDDEINSNLALLIEKAFSLDDFMPKLLDIFKKLPSEKLQYFVGELTKHKLNEINDETQIEDKVLNFDCDKMNNLVKKYFSNLQKQQKNEFLLDLMSFASSELPATKQFVNCHINILQSFVQKMSD